MACTDWIGLAFFKNRLYAQKEPSDQSLYWLPLEFVLSKFLGKENAVTNFYHYNQCCNYLAGSLLFKVGGVT